MMTTAMSLSSAVALNDTAGAMLEVANMATAPGLSSTSSFHSTPASADDAAAARLEEILDPRDICRAAIVHLQASVRAEAEAEQRALADMRRNVANGRNAAADSSRSSMDCDCDASGTFVSTATLSLPSTASSSTGDNKKKNHPHVPHAEVLQARQRLEKARQVVVNMAQQGVDHSNHAGSSVSANGNNTNTNTASSNLVRRLYNLPVRVGDTATANISVHTTTSSPSSSASPPAGVLNHQHQRPQSESVSGLVLYNYALSNQILGLRRLQASESASASTHGAATTATAYFRKACALYDMSLQVLEANVARQIDAAEAMERWARNGNCDVFADATTSSTSSRGDGSGGDQHDRANGADIDGGAMEGDNPASSASPPSPSISPSPTTGASSHHVGPSLEQLTLLCAAACLHNSAALLAYVHNNTNGDDDNGDDDDNDEVQDIQSRSSSVLTLCNVQRTLTLLQQVPSPCTNRGDIEEAWNLFFFAALDIPLVELANAA